MNQNNNKLDLVNPLNPNQIIKTEILSEIKQELQPSQNDTQDIINPIQNPDVNDETAIETKNKPKKKNILLLIILLLILIGIGVGIVFFLQKNKKPTVPPNNSENKQETITYEYNLEGFTDSFTAKVNDDYTLKLIFENDIYNLYINDLFILSDGNMGKIKFYMIDGNLIYVNNVTDVRSETIYVIDKNSNVTQIYELDDILGMVPSEIDFENDSIIIKATRLSHNYSIIHNNSIFDATINDNTTWAQYGITEDTIIEATYTYKFENNNLNMQPTISDEVSIKQYLQNNM